MMVFRRVRNDSVICYGSLFPIVSEQDFNEITYILDMHQLKVVEPTSVADNEIESKCCTAPYANKGHRRPHYQSANTRVGQDNTVQGEARSNCGSVAYNQ